MNNDGTEQQGTPSKNNLGLRKMTLKSRILSWLGVLIGFIAGGFISPSIHKAQPATNKSEATVTAHQMPMRQDQGEVVPELQMTIDGDLYYASANTQKLTIETTELQRIIRGETTIERAITKKTVVEPAEKASGSDKTVLMTLLLGAISFLDLGTALLGFLKAKKEVAAPTTQPVVEVSVDVNNVPIIPGSNVYVITSDADPSEVAARLKQVFGAGHVTFTEVDLKPDSQGDRKKSESTQ